MRARLPWIIAGALLALPSGPSLASDDDQRVAWLRANAIPLATLDPASPDLVDLAPLRKVLDGVRVVMLGEATRGDGSAFLAKTRLIRFLHQELGFDVIVFEGGFYDCALAWEDIQGGAHPRQALGRGLFPFYTEAAQFQPLLDYLAGRAGSARPLTVAGIDSQSADDRVLAALRAALPGFGIDPAMVTGLVELEAALGDVVSGRYASGEVAVPSARSRRRVVSAIGELRRQLTATREGRPAAGSFDRSFWLQVLDNVQTDAEANWRAGKWRPGQPFAPELHNLRDRQMGDNLIWLAQHRYRERKLIVWSLNVHLARDLDRLGTRDPATRAKFDEMSTVGDRVASELGQQVYTIATTAFSGRHGTPSRNPNTLLSPMRGSFEDLMARTGLAAALVDLRRPPAGGRWLQRGLIARPISYKELLGIWPRHLDALLYLHTLEASTRIGRSREPSGQLEPLQCSAGVPSSATSSAVCRSSSSRVAASSTSRR